MDFGSRMENFVINLRLESESGNYVIDLGSEGVKMRGDGIYIKQQSTEMIRDCVGEKKQENCGRFPKEAAYMIKKQGRIHGTSGADGWAEAVMQKPLGIQQCDRQTDGRTDTARC